MTMIVMVFTKLQGMLISSPFYLHIFLWWIHFTKIGIMTVKVTIIQQGMFGCLIR